MGYLLRLIPILTTFALFDVRPNKHASEMFAGERQWSGNMLELGYVVQSFDSRHNLCHDFLTPTGFLVAIVTVMTICLNGILWLAPPCSSWVWMSRFSTGRHLSLLGHLFNNNVQSQNALVGRLCYVIVLAIKRGVFFIIEQPASSIMWDHPRLKAVLEKYSDILFRCELQLGSYNYEVPKATVLIGTAPQLQHLGRRMSPNERLWMRSFDDRIHTASHDHTGSRGNRNLRPTQAYPAGFGAAHALAYRDLNLYDLGMPMTPGHTLDLSDDDAIPGLIDDEPDPYLEDLYREDSQYWVHDID